MYPVDSQNVDGVYKGIRLCISQKSVIGRVDIFVTGLLVVNFGTLGILLPKKLKI